MITVLTPSYNRAYILDKAYKSLCKQTQKNFEWLIIDDGSTDNTEDIIKKFLKENKVNIRYYKKENGGKHTAINYGVSKAKGDYLIILDSDDSLKQDAIQLINMYCNKYKKCKNIAALSFTKVFTNNVKVGSKMKDDEIVSNHIDYRYNGNMLGDMAEVFKTSVLRKYPFPVFFEEKFLSETIIWNEIALMYDTVYINKAIYVCEYLEDGLSQNYFKLVSNNPYGAMMVSHSFFNKRFKLLIRIKNAILYNGYKICAKKKYKNIKIEDETFGIFLMKFPGYLFYLMYLKK